MQVTLNPGSPAEVRLIAAFMQDLADLQELMYTPEQPAAPIQAEATEAIAQPKKTRSKKTEPVVESGSSETAAPVEGEAGNAAPAASTEAPDGANQKAPAAGPDASVPVASLDEMRILFGKLTEAGKRDAAIAVVRSYKVNGLAEIPEVLRGEVFAKMQAL